MSVAAAPLSAAGNPYCFGLCTWAGIGEQC